MPVEHRDDPAWGDVWTWTALDADSKLIFAWYVGNRVHAGVGEPDCYANCVSSSKPDKRRARTTGESGVASH